MPVVFTATMRMPPPAAVARNSSSAIANSFWRHRKDWCEDPFP